MTTDEKGFLNPGIRKPSDAGYVVVELRHDSSVAYSPSGFAAPAAAEPTAEELNSVLEKFNAKRIESHFGMAKSKIRKRVTAAPNSLDVPVNADFAHSGFVQVHPRRKGDSEDLAKALNSADGVWKAVVAPEPVPAGAATGDSTETRNFEPAQGYLCDAPNGIGAMAAWENYQATGKGITICDIEGNWHFDHEDLPRFRLLGGDLVDDPGWRNHGTAVLGEMVSKTGTKGTVGISHDAKAAVHSAVINGNWNSAAAITGAASRMKEGDVILIELQATGPNGKYVAMQYWDDTFSAIRAAVAKGVTVVEAAGNGDENFDLPIFNNTGLQKDSGAIVVGAGIPPTNRFDFFGNEWGFAKYGRIGTPRSRIFFSNYGKILNVQGWGWHVTTTGYGDAQGGSDQNRWYTHRFSGTSSASPIVTGAVAVLQSHAKATNGVPLSPANVRTILTDTGTPQEAGPGVPISQHIGPQPNLEKALAAI